MPVMPTWRPAAAPVAAGAEGAGALGEEVGPLVGLVYTLAVDAIEELLPPGTGYGATEEDTAAGDEETAATEVVALVVAHCG